MKAHTILLIQTSSNVNSRSFSDYETVHDCIVGVTHIFEEFLKFSHRELLEISYDVSQLLQFIDAAADMSCLVFEQSSNKYIPYNKDWIKQKCYQYIVEQTKVF